MKDFTAVLVFGFPTPWPPRAVTTLHSSTLPEGQIISLIAHPDGHLEVTAAQAPNPASVLSERFQQIAVQGPNLVTLFIIGGDGGFDLRIDGDKLQKWPGDGAHPPALVVPLREPPPAEVSFLSPAAETATMVARRTREIRFKTRAKFHLRHTPSRPRSIEEQREDLQISIQSLRSHREEVSNGKMHLFGSIAGELRSLVYWPSAAHDKPTWNPLLLRMADAEGVGLPVFVSRDHTTEPPSIVKSALLHIDNLGVSCVRESTADVLVDLEDYLARQVVVARPVGEGMRQASIGDIINYSANTGGPAHYGESVPLVLDDMLGHVIFDRTLLHNLLLRVADAVIDLGGFVLDEGEPLNQP